MSGSGLSPWSLVSEPAKYAAIVSHHVNCSPDLPHDHLMKCLREKPLDALLSTPIRQPDFGNIFGPSIDGVVIGNGKNWIIELKYRGDERQGREKNRKHKPFKLI